MKSNAIMTRKMGEFNVLQRTSDGMFNATELLRQWNALGDNKKRDMDNFWKQAGLLELMREIAENELDSKYVESTGLKNALSKTVRGKHGGGTWMHKFLFIKFAMYLSPRFEYQVIKFVYDELIKNRHLAGDNYNKLTAQLVKFKDIDYAQVAQALNYIVFNKHYRGIRNDATPKSLQELHELEDKLAFSIEMGLVTSYDQLITVMRKMYSDKYPKPF